VPRYYRKIIKIRAEDSPNVRMAMAKIKLGLKPERCNEIPGVLTYDEYVQRRTTWDPVRQSIGLDAEFWEGAETLLYPPDWLNKAERLHDTICTWKRHAKGIGVDPAEGGANTAMAAVDEYGLMELVSRRTPDTNAIPNEILAFMIKHGVPPERVRIDRGGGGKIHANILRERGYNVQTVAFGEPVTNEEKLNRRRRKKSHDEAIVEKEERYHFKNRRAEMYGTLRVFLDPSLKRYVGNKDEFTGFALPAEYIELRRQLSLIPLSYDQEGRLYLLPKYKRSPNSTERTLTEIIGCSPDEADALVLAIHAMQHLTRRIKITAF
jgi:hypothetical protein